MKQKLFLDVGIEKIKGKIGSKVKIKVKRLDENNEEQILDFEIERKNIEMIRVTSTVLENNIGYINISNFDGTKVGEQFEEEYDKLLSQGMQSLIIDVRSNGGGIVDEAIEIADLLTDKNQVLLIEKDKNGNEKETRSKKDKKIKNHLIIDEYASEIIKEIFDMYVNKGMSPQKIADELNKKEILAPAVYLKIPTFMKRESSNSNGKYLWHRTQIGKILKNEVYIGNVVGRKFQKVSHKIAKVRNTNPEEYIIVKNMHEPIIDIDMWNRAQEKIRNKHTVRTRKFNHPLKGLIFCKECGGIATLRTRTEQRKSGKEWRIDYFICSNKNSNRGNCNNKQIRADFIEEQIKKELKKEIEKITYSKEEIKNIFIKSKIKAKEELSRLEIKLKTSMKELELLNNMLEEIYQDKVNKIIRQEDFEKFYSKKIEEKTRILSEIKTLEYEIKKQKEELEKVDMNIILKQTKEVLSLKNVTKEMYEKLIEKIEFDSDKNIFIKFKFEKYI